jgi:magnesium-protoporphyrin IX monomethyl ester (oxidative) cyclase
MPIISGDELDINAPVPLDYDVFLDSLDRAFPGGEVKPVLLFETSRGCWWGAKQRCAFCGLNGPSLRYRAMKPENAVTQIRSLFRYAPRCSFLESVDTILPEDYVTTVMPSLQPPSGMKIQYEVRPEFSESDLENLCAAGVTVLQPGIESLSTATLKLMRKGTTAFQNIRFLKACGKFPLEIGWNLLIGSPGESEATYENYLRVLPLLSHLHPPQTASLVGFVRYSEYHERAREHGLNLQPEDYYRLTFPFDDAAIARVAIKFRDANADAERMNGWLTKLNEAVARWRERWLSGARLCLARDGDTAFVFDSRGGKPLQHALDAATLDALELLEQPRPASEVGGSLAFLRERGLVFEEGGRCLSLVIL